MTEQAVKPSKDRAIYRVWLRIKNDHDEIRWPDYTGFYNSIPLRPSILHRFHKRDQSKPYNLANSIWKHSKIDLPLGATDSPTNTNLPLVTYKGAYYSPLHFTTYFGDGLWHCTCEVCGAKQVRRPGLDGCLACAKRSEAVKPSARARRALTGRYYYALNALRSPMKHRSGEAFTAFWENLPTDKHEKQKYVLEYWVKR